jgi:hypothetical protein
MSVSKSDDNTVQAPKAMPPQTESPSKKEDEISRPAPIELRVIGNGQDASVEDQTVPPAEEAPDRRQMEGWRLYVLTFG